MSLSKSSPVRISSQVYPVWLARALIKAEPPVVSSPSQLRTKHLPSLQYSASSRTIFSNQETTSSNWSFKPPSRHRPTSQQERALSIPLRRSSFSTTAILPQVTYTQPPTKDEWLPPTDISTRPVTIIGAGVLGRRLAVLWASTGRPVNVYDISPPKLDSACTYVADSLSSFCAENDTHPGHVHFARSLQDAVQNAWMVIEAVPEDLEVKISLLGRLDRSVSNDCIIATCSSTFKSRELVSEVGKRERVLNTLYYVPPKNRCVELMGCGYTAASLFPFLTAQMEEVNLRPKIAHRESEGLILPRIWASIKRECLMELQEGVCTPQDIDELFKDFFGAKRGPCEKMDEIGLDTVATVERHFLDRDEWRKGGKGWAHLRWLEEEHVGKGKLGDKTGEGLVKHQNKEEEHKIGAEIWREHAVDLSGL